MATQVGPRKTRRTNLRLARLRLDNPNALPKVKADGSYTRREFRKVKRKAKASRPAAPKPKSEGANYNPLAPLSGKSFNDEIRARTRARYNAPQGELRDEMRDQDVRTTNTAGYYDDYRQALRESTARVKATNEAQIKQQEGRVDTAFGQDSTASATRDAALSAQAAKLGRGAVTTAEGQQAASAARSQGNQQVGRMRTQAVADEKLQTGREANSVLAKIEGVGRQNAKADKLRKEMKRLKAERGDYKVAQRGELRDAERQYAMLRKEFKLDKKELALDTKSSRADRKIEQQKLNAQKIIARLYSNADKAGAKAQIRVAKLQLEKGRITKDQYRRIVNEYRGLPGGAKIDGSGTQGGKQPAGKGGSGPNGSYAPWEKDKIDLAVRSLMSASPNPDQKREMIDKLVKRGDIPARLAREAWKRYTRKRNAAVNKSPGGDAAQ
jgi:hypothetical protein